MYIGRRTRKVNDGWCHQVKDDERIVIYGSRAVSLLSLEIKDESWVYLVLWDYYYWEGILLTDKQTNLI